jgi:erythromycin esterase-like protein
LKTVDAEQWLSFKAFAAQAGDFKSGKVIDRPKLDEAKATLRRLLVCFDTHHARFTEARGEREWRLAEQNTRVALQAIGLLENYKDEVRDAAMAQNVQWILREEGAAGRIMLWAHNAHLSHPPKILWGLFPVDMARAFTPMGTRLRKIMGPDYTAFGFAFNQGELRAQPVKTNSVGPASTDSLDAVLPRTGTPISALDVRPLPDDPDAVSEQCFLRCVRPHRMVTSDRCRSQMFNLCSLWATSPRFLTGRCGGFPGVTRM